MTEDASARTWIVGGMDCAVCAGKIRGALERLPGVTDVQISVMSERLTLKLARSATPAEEIKRQVRRLGYSVSPAVEDGERSAGTSGARNRPDLGSPDTPPATDGQGDHAEHGHDRGPSDGPWYRTGKGRLVILTGTLLAAAWAAMLVTLNALRS